MVRLIPRGHTHCTFNLTNCPDSTSGTSKRLQVVRTQQQLGSRALYVRHSPRMQPLLSSEDRFAKRDAISVPVVPIKVARRARESVSARGCGGSERRRACGSRVGPPPMPDKTVPKVARASEVECDWMSLATASTERPGTTRRQLRQAAMVRRIVQEHH